MQVYEIAGNTDGNLELDYYGGISDAVPMLEDYLPYDGGILYYDYPGLGDHVAIHKISSSIMVHLV